MRLQFISEFGAGLGLAHHLSSEGHAVSLITRARKDVGSNIVDTTKSSFEAADITFCDDALERRFADERRKFGDRVLGVSQWSTTLEEDPEYQRSLIRAIGWPLDTLKTGTHLYITGWFNGTRFISVYTSLVYRRLMSGGAGADIGCSGMLGHFGQPTSRLYQTFIKPLEAVLKRVNHRGCFHTHALINGDDFCVKEVSATFTHPLSFLLHENSNLSVADIWLRLFNEDSKEIKNLEEWASGALISIPPFPYHKQITVPSVEIKGIQPSNLKHLWLVDACKRGDKWMSAGETGMLGYITSRGETIAESVKRMYRTVGFLSVPDLQYRNDIGRRLAPIYEGLIKSDWIKVTNLYETAGYQRSFEHGKQRLVQK